MVDQSAAQCAVEPRWSERRPVLALACWLFGALGTLLLLHTAGTGSLSPPRDPAEWAAWISGRDPMVAIVAGVRLIVLAVGWYLLVSVVFGVLARALRSARLIRAADLMTVGPVRRAVGAALGMLLTAGVAGGQPAAAAPGTAKPLPVELVIGAQHDEAATEPLTVQIDGEALRPVPRDGALIFEGSMRSAPASGQGDGLDDARRAPQGEPRAITADEAPTTEVLPDGAGTDGVAADGAATDGVAAGETASEGDLQEHQVKPGESFWSIAGSVLRVEAAEVSETEVADYWLQLIDANRDRLLVDDDPDLLYPGQRLVLPAADLSASS